jgi:hypothetical protein
MFRRFNFSFLGISSSRPANKHTHTVRVIARGSFPVCLCRDRERTPSPRTLLGLGARENPFGSSRETQRRGSLIFVSPLAYK